jgi:hypothetical protein
MLNAPLLYIHLFILLTDGILCPFYLETEPHNLKQEVFQNSIKKCFWPLSENDVLTLLWFPKFVFADFNYQEWQCGSPHCWNRTLEKWLYGSVASPEVWCGFIKINIKYNIWNLWQLCYMKYNHPWLSEMGNSKLSWLPVLSIRNI